MGLAAHNLREVQELRRVREERFLATLLQVEKSHVPFPDEPGDTMREHTRLAGARAREDEERAAEVRDRAPLLVVQGIEDRVHVYLSLWRCVCCPTLRGPR